MKYARKVGGCWIDVYDVGQGTPFVDVSDLARKLGVTDFLQVDDAVKHGDFVSGDTGHISRPPPLLPIQEVRRTREQVRDVAAAAWGGGTSGRTRAGAIFKAFKASDIDEVVFLFDQFMDQELFTKTDMAGLLSRLVANSIGPVGTPITSQERLDFLNEW